MLTTETPKTMIKSKPPIPITITAIAHCGISLSSFPVSCGVITFGITKKSIKFIFQYKFPNLIFSSLHFFFQFEKRKIYQRSL